MEKYEITSIAHPQYPWLHRIRALRNVREDVRAGDLGGFVESESNLSQEGTCWIYDNAIACENARVTEDSTLHRSAKVLDAAVISGDACLDWSAFVMHNAVVASGDISGLAIVGGHAKILGGASNHSSPMIRDEASICGEVIGNIEISGFYEVLPSTKIENHRREPLRLHSDEFAGYMMVPREPQKPAGFVLPPKQKKRSEIER